MSSAGLPATAGHRRCIPARLNADLHAEGKGGGEHAAFSTRVMDRDGTAIRDDLEPGSNRARTGSNRHAAAPAPR
jgi:hypothetical protein